MSLIQLFCYAVFHTATILRQDIRLVTALSTRDDDINTFQLYTYIFHKIGQARMYDIVFYIVGMKGSSSYTYKEQSCGA